MNLDVVAARRGPRSRRVALASTFGFLSFAGFESAGSLGEEATRPTAHDPARRSIAAIAFGGVFYVACVAVQTLGFGTDAAGVARVRRARPPRSASWPTTYVGAGMADALDLGRARQRGRRRARLRVGRARGCSSRWAATGGCRRAGERLAAPARRRPAWPSSWCSTWPILVVFGAAGAAPMNVFFYFATIGTLSLLAMYVLTNVAAAALPAPRRRVRRSWCSRSPASRSRGYVLYHNVSPVPTRPSTSSLRRGGWLVIGIGLAFWRRG